MALAISLSYSASVEMAGMSFKSSSCSSCPSPSASCLSRWSTWLYQRLSPVHLGHLLVHHGYSQEVWSGLPAPLPLFGTTPPPNRTPPLKDFSRVEEVALYGFKVCQVVSMLSLPKGGQKEAKRRPKVIIKRSPSYSKGVPSGWLLRSSKQVNWFFLQPWWACRWPCPSVCPSFLSNQLTYGLIGDAISDTFIPQKTSPPHLFFIRACSLHPGLLRLSDLSLLLLLLLMTSLGSEPESNSSTLAALQIGCLRPPLPLFDLGR